MCTKSILITGTKTTNAASFLSLICKIKNNHSGNHWSEYDVGNLRQSVTWSDNGEFLEVNN